MSVKVTLSFLSAAAAAAFLQSSGYVAEGDTDLGADGTGYAPPAPPPQMPYNAPVVNQSPQYAPPAGPTAPTGGYAPQPGQPAPGGYAPAPAAPPLAASGAISQTQVTQAAQAYSKARGGAKAALAVLAQFGVKAVGELRPDQYPAALQAFAV